MLALDQAIRERDSTRMFLARPVPRALMDEALAEVSVTGYPEITGAQFSIPAERSILCGLAVG
jgi:hypothetical protein